MRIEYVFLGTVKSMKVSSETATLMQKRIMPSQTREVKIRATGSGVAVIEVGYQYNLNVTAAWPSFVVNPFVTKVRPAGYLAASQSFIRKQNQTQSQHHRGRRLSYLSRDTKHVIIYYLSSFLTADL